MNKLKEKEAFTRKELEEWLNSVILLYNFDYNNRVSNTDRLAFFIGVYDYMK